jgi:hypothetical protein
LEGEEREESEGGREAPLRVTSTTLDTAADVPRATRSRYEESAGKEWIASVLEEPSLLPSLP